MIGGIVCDLDGTVHRSGRPLPGAVEALAEIRSAGIGVVFVSNNPTVPAATCATRLTDMGIPTRAKQVVTSGGVTAEWLRRHHPDDGVLLVSEPPLRAELVGAGVTVVEDPTHAQVVVVSFDRTFDYAKWKTAFDALRRGARFIATNADATCPVDGGEVPDCAGIIAALEATTGRRLEFVVGKPSPVTATVALHRLRAELADDTLAPGEVLVVGDRLETDLQMGTDAGFATALVLTGVSHPADVSGGNVEPMLVLAGLHELPEHLSALGGDW